jgi:hypothetical protein
MLLFICQAKSLGKFSRFLGFSVNKNVFLGTVSLCCCNLFAMQYSLQPHNNQSCSFDEQRSARVTRSDRQRRDLLYQGLIVPPCLSDKDKQRLVMCGTGYCLGGVVGCCGVMTGNVYCVASGLGCMALTQVGVGINMCLSKAKKCAHIQQSVPRQYSERPVEVTGVAAVFLKKSRDTKNDMSVQLPGQVEK